MTQPLPGLLNTMNASGPLPIGQNTPGLLGAIMQRLAAANMRQPAPTDPEAERAMAELLGLIRPQQQTAQRPE